MIEVKKYLPADAVLITQDRMLAEKASWNGVAGPGFTIFSEGKPIACGGIRVQGCGVAWFAFNEEAKKNHLRAVIKEAKQKLEEMQRDNELCEVYAESEDADVWLKHLGFHKKNDIFVR